MSTYDYGEPVHIRLGKGTFSENDLDSAINIRHNEIHQLIDNYIDNLPRNPLAIGNTSIEPDTSKYTTKGNIITPSGAALPIDSVNLYASSSKYGSRVKGVCESELIEEAISILNDELSHSPYQYSEGGELVKVVGKKISFISNFGLLINRSIYTWHDQRIVDRKLEIAVFSKRHCEFQNIILTQKEFLRENWISNHLDISRYYYTPGMYTSLYEAAQKANMLMPIVNEYRHIGWVYINDDYQYIDGGVEYYEYRK